MKNKHSRSLPYAFSVAFCLLAIGGLTGCAGFFPSSGPSRRDIQKASKNQEVTGIQIVDITGAVAAKLLESQKRSLFSEVFGAEGPSEYIIGAGDGLEVWVWEAPPGTLFSSGITDVSGGAVTSPSARSTVIPEQMVNSDGTIKVPFAGNIPVAGHTLRLIEATITKRLEGIAHQPQVLVRLVRNASADVAVVGEVANSVRMPLTPHRERLLDALAAAGGPKQSVRKIMLQVTRGNIVDALPLEMVIRDPKQNIVLQPGDVITALYQPLSFTALGAAGKNDEVPFEDQGISLVQALGRAGGLVDARSNPEGVFIFRFESGDAMDWPVKPVMVTPDGKVPVVYRANLKDPATFFAAQNFPVKDKDLIYVSNASMAEVQKFLQMVMSVAYPAAITSIQMAR